MEQLKLEMNIIFIVAGVKPFVSVLREAGIETHRSGCIVVDEFGRTQLKVSLPLEAMHQQSKI